MISNHDQKGILHVLHAQLYRLLNRKYKCGILKNKTNISFPFLGVALKIPWHLRYFLILICFLGGVFAELQSVARPWWSPINVISKIWNYWCWGKIISRQKKNQTIHNICHFLTIPTYNKRVCWFFCVAKRLLVWYIYHTLSIISLVKFMIV